MYMNYSIHPLPVNIVMYTIMCNISSYHIGVRKFIQPLLVCHDDVYNSISSNVCVQNIKYTSLRDYIGRSCIDITAADYVMT